MTKLWIGIGCQRGVSSDSIESAIFQTLALQDLQTADVVGVASIDRKAQEPGILAVCAQYRWPLQTYSAAELNNVQIQRPSGIAQLVGTNSVAEAAAILASGQELLVKKQIYAIALGASEAIGGKFITVAIAPQNDGSMRILVQDFGKIKPPA